MFAVELEVPLETAQILTYNLLFIFHRFLELKTYRSMFTNETTIIASTLRNNPAYVSIYLTWMKIIIIEAIPYISILTLNICILKKVYNASKYRQSFRQNHYIEVAQDTIFMEQNWYFVTKIVRIYFEKNLF